MDIPWQLKKPSAKTGISGVFLISYVFMLDVLRVSMDFLIFSVDFFNFSINLMVLYTGSCYSFLIYCGIYRVYIYIYICVFQLPIPWDIPCIYIYICKITAFLWYRRSLL